MDFFVLQDKARSQTKILTLLFITAVILIIGAINLVFFLVMKTQSAEYQSLNDWFSQPYWLYISLATALIIIATSLIRTWQLSSTPDAVARMVNATPVKLNSSNIQEKRLINVVEEMSIAAGVPMPKIFIMKAEPGINAFVAGLEPQHICLVVTQGLLDSLNHQELQGVIAHEYSHVFHGDMRINVRLIGILAGILVLGQLGQILLRTSTHGRRSSKDSGNAFAVLAIGAGLFAIGYIGLFFGRLIKAAISRQREFLADASAVQYTRDKEGICGALAKIAMNQNAALLNSNKAEEMSHLCFGQSVKLGFSGWLATHPPLDERIRAIDPNFKFNAAKHGINNDLAAEAESAIDTLTAGFAASGIADSPHAPRTANIDRQQAIENIGAVTPQHLAGANQLMASIPQALLAIARAENSTANERDLILGLLIANQQAAEQSLTDPTLIATHQIDVIRDLARQLKQLNSKQQHLLFEIALSRLAEQDTQSKRQFVGLLSKLVSQEQSLSLTEFMIYASSAKRALGEAKSTRPISRFKTIENEIVEVFNLLYLQSNESPTTKQAQFEKQLKLLGLKTATLTDAVFSAQDFGRALNQIAKLHPLLKKDFISLCVEIVQSDGVVNQQEYELLRLLGEYLGCPFPIAIE